MRIPGQKIQLSTETDVLARLSLIHKYAEEIEAGKYEVDVDTKLKRIGYLIAYLTVIIHKHLKEGAK